MTLGKESKADRAEGCAVEEAIPSSLGFTAAFTPSQQCPVPRAAWREFDSLTARQLGFPPPEPPRAPQSEWGHRGSSESVGCP